MLISIIPISVYILGPTLPIFLYFSNKAAFVVFCLTIALYSLYKLTTYVLFSILGLIKIILAESNDWVTKINGRLPLHLIAIAVNKEPYNVLVKTLDSILTQDYPINKLFLSVSFEDNHCNLLTGKKVNSYLLSKNINFTIAYHPSNLPGEVKGAASNKKHAVEKGVKKFFAGNQSGVIATIPDADTVFNPNFFSCLSYTWLNHPKKDKRFFQPAMYKVQNNFKKLRLFSKILSTSLTLSILSSSTYRPAARYTFSCFSLSLSTLINAGYWDTSIAIDDTPFYWRPYNLYNSDWRNVPLLTSVSLHGIYDKNIFKNLTSQYSQFYRWGYGVISLKIAFKTIFKNPNIPIIIKMIDIVKALESMVFVKVGFITSLVSSLLYAHLETEIEVIAKLLSFLPFLGFLLIIVKLFLIFYSELKISIIGLVKNVIFEIPINILNLLLFGYLPYAHAALHLALNLNHHEKITWSEKD